MNVK